MAIGDDFSIATNGDIRYTGSGTNYTVLAFHVWIGGLADDDQATGDDLVDITTDTPSDRSTDQIITLNAPFNIDDTAARHLYDGSVTQNGGDDLYSGMQFLGSVVAGTEIMIIQDDKVLPAYWGTGINADAANAIIMRLLVKSRSGGADIDGKRVLTMSRELGDQFKEFSVTLGLANSVSALSTLADLNNVTADATIEGWTTITNVEGFQLIDIDNDTIGEEYYSQLNKGSQSLNDTYEFTKHVSQRAHIVLNGTDTATDYTIDDATIFGQAQSFTSRAAAEKLVEARFRIKIDTGAPTGDLTAEIYATAGGVIPTGAALATSEPVLGTLIRSAYTEIIFRFNDNFTMAAATQYAIVIRHPDGGAGDFFAVEGAAVGGVAGENKAEDTGSWAAQAGADLWFTVKGSPIWHSKAGELFRGITHEIVYDNEVGGPFSEAADETLFWGTRVTYDGDAGTFEVGRYAEIQPAGGGAKKNGGKILKDDVTNNVLWLALEDSTGAGAGLILDGDLIAQIGGTAASAVVNFPSVTGNGTTDLDFTTGANTIDRIAGSFVTDGFVVGGRIDVTGSVSNNGIKNITAVAALQLTVSETLTTELNVAATVTAIAVDDDKAGGEGILLALDDNGADGDVYIQLFSGAAPVDNLQIEGRTSGATADVNATVTARPVSPEFIGATTGTNLIGAYGIGFEKADIGASDKFFDLTNTLRVPPNNVTFTVTGLVSGEDRVLVGPRTGSALTKNQLTTDTTLSAATETLIQCSTAIPTDTPESGTGAENTRVRVELDSGIYRRVQYDSYTANDFTITVGPDDDWTGANVSTTPKDVFVAYIDVLADGTSEAYTAVYKGTDQDVLVRVRDGGATPIKTFEGLGVFGDTSSSLAAIRQSDA